MSNLLPIGDIEVSPWVPTISSELWSEIDDSPATPDLGDYIYYQTADAETQTLSLDVNPLSVVPTDATLRFVAANAEHNIYLTAVELRDADEVVIAQYDGADVPIAATASLHSVVLTLQPGSFNLAAASLVATFAWPGGGLSALAIHALDVVVSGERRTATAGFFLNLCGFPG